MKVENLVRDNVTLRKEQGHSTLFEREFQTSSLFHYTGESSLMVRAKSYLDQENKTHCRILLNELIIDNIIFEIYELSREDRDKVKQQSFVNPFKYPITEAAQKHWLDDFNGESSDLSSEKEVIQLLPKTVVSPIWISKISASSTKSILSMFGIGLKKVT
jgi:hypothetical protein